MLLRYLVSHYVRQAAEQKLQESVQGAAQSAAQSAAEGETSDAPPIEPEVLFLFATSTESAGLMDQLSDRQSTLCATFVQHLGRIQDRPIGVIEIGIGAEGRQAIEDAIKIHRPAWVVAAGFAAAVAPDLRRGEILMASEIVNDNASERLDVGLRMSAEAVEAVRGLRLGRLASVETMLAARDEKVQLGEATDALACDMESFSVAKQCQQLQTRFLSVQVITDGLDDRIPPELEKMLGQETLAAKLGAAAGAIFNRPSSMKDMWNLREQALRATDRLAKFLISMLPQLSS